MQILDEFSQNKINVQKNLEETSNTVLQLKETVVKMQRYELAAHLREMEKQLTQMQTEFKIGFTK